MKRILIAFVALSLCAPLLRAQSVSFLNINTDPADNGRILEAEYLETTITDVDLEIIATEYTGEIKILQGWYASYKPLPRVFVEEVIKYYKNKTELKGVKGQEIYYDKAKALLNSLY